MAAMAEFRKNPDVEGMEGVRASDFPHYDRINSTMKRAQMKAWAKMKAMPEIQKILLDKRNEQIMKNNAGKTDTLAPENFIMKNK